MPEVAHTLEEWSYWAGTYEFHAGVDSPAPDLEIHIDTSDILSRSMELIPADLVRGWIEAVPPVMLRGPVALPDAFSLSVPVAAAIGRLGPDRSAVVRARSPLPGSAMSSRRGSCRRAGGRRPRPQTASFRAGIPRYFRTSRNILAKSAGW